MLRNNISLFKPVAVSDQTVTSKTSELVLDSDTFTAEQHLVLEAETPVNQSVPAEELLEHQASEPEPVTPGESFGLNNLESFRALGLVVVAALPVMAVAALLRLWDFSLQSAYMDEANYIITGRMLTEHGQIYDNALHWTFGSYLYPILAGLADAQGGLVAARAVSLAFGLVTVLATIFLTLGLFKNVPQTKTQAEGDFAISSKPVMASLLAGLIVAILPTAIALSKFATYDAMAAAMFASGCAVFVWARREAKMAEMHGISRTPAIVALFATAASFFFLAFLAKYIVAIFFPALCLLVLFTKHERIKALFGFVLPLSIACAAYYFVFATDLSTLLSFAGQYHDLRSDDLWSVYIWNRIDIVVLALLGYWGLRQAFRDGRPSAGILPWVGVIILLGFQLVTRPDFDYWKHSIYIVIMLAPLAGWLWSDWSWWDEPNGAHQPGRLQRGWHNLKLRFSGLRKVAHLLEGNAATEKPGSYSMMAVLATGLVVLGLVWSQPASNVLLNHWLSIAPVVDRAQQAVQEQLEGQVKGTVLVDDAALTYYLYNQIPVGNITDPFFNNYKGLSGVEAYKQAVRDQQYNTIIFDGGVTPQGKLLWSEVRPVIRASSAYLLTFSQSLEAPGGGKQDFEIYRLLTQDEQSQRQATVVAPTQTTVATSPTPNVSKSAVTATTVAPKTAATTVAPQTAAPTQAPTTTVVASPKATVAPPTVAPKATFPANPTYDFGNGDEGWGALPAVGELQPGMAVVSTDAFQLDGHKSLKFTPQPSNKIYTVGVNRTGSFHKIHLYVFIPADKADAPVRMGLYYFDAKWNWNDNGFQTQVVPGQWTELSWELPAAQTIQQFGLKQVGFSGAIYICGVTVE